MSSNDFDLQKYLANGVENIVKEALRVSFKDPKESLFMAKFAASSRKATKRRNELNAAGEHVPPFLIASITSSCNMHCAGCYSRHTHATVDSEPMKQLTGEEWDSIFKQADELGVSFILLAGGEPMLRRDVIEKAASNDHIIFPIFTNGTYMDEEYFKMFDKHRNLIPVMSIEGKKDITDARRGEGVYDKLIINMDRLCADGILYGASVTATKKNVEEIASDGFIDELSKRNCRLVIFVEYVPMTQGTDDIAFEDDDRDYLKDQIAKLRSDHPEMMFVSFPGDEKTSGGCIAAGRGFFHINSHGDAEPCPFSPYSDINVKETSLREALRSKLFTALRESDVLTDDHVGGCVLHEKEDRVREFLGLHS